MHFLCVILSGKSSAKNVSRERPDKFEKFEWKMVCLSEMLKAQSLLLNNDVYMQFRRSKANCRFFIEWKNATGTFSTFSAEKVLSNHVVVTSNGMWIVHVFRFYFPFVYKLDITANKFQIIFESVNVSNDAFSTISHLTLSNFFQKKKYLV